METPALYASFATAAAVVMWFGFDLLYMRSPMRWFLEREVTRWVVLVLCVVTVALVSVAAGAALAVVLLSIGFARRGVRS